MGARKIKKVARDAESAGRLARVISLRFHREKVHREKKVQDAEKQAPQMTQGQKSDAFELHRWPDDFGISGIAGGNSGETVDVEMKPGITYPGPRGYLGRYGEGDDDEDEEGRDEEGKVGER